MIFQTESNNISAEELQAHVTRFLSQERPRRIRLNQYYQGEQGVRKGPIAQGRPNNQLTANYARYITDVHTGYFLGAPPTLTFERRRVQERMLRALDNASLEAMQKHLTAHLSAGEPRDFAVHKPRKRVRGIRKA